MHGAPSSSTWCSVISGVRGFEVKYVRNFTDVDDKIINRAREEGITPADVAHKYIEAYQEDMKRLGVGRPMSSRRLRSISRR